MRVIELVAKGFWFDLEETMCMEDPILLLESGSMEMMFKKFMIQEEHFAKKILELRSCLLKSTWGVKQVVLNNCV